ncbi:hypothetical protein [Levilactobacillus tujiorum]|uniref:Uncharacterized protein n=1 Tax=Levilactobacillus tujiorum TaxID=2912243 RepID=A0ABX1L4Z9_9LACO|nr:hypothetical protein [Levilactobacillus tujiorum]MCH5463969.1 hypothetical protein [Levilactobacillus tujiorum]NLR11525.1 hypothetical protein [Lactobacillus sp. HBUAS51387]NLR28957.1 hypothetical protein [Levilactobacillus tujiorum]
MPEIKVIGDILSGKFQPTLTGNAVVDAALIDRFCQSLITALALTPHAVQAEHHWNLQVDPATIYIIDDHILKTSGHHRVANVIPVSHPDLLHGQVDVTKRKLAPILAAQSSLK